MIRNKIERWILSEHHQKHPNIVFGLTVFSAIIIIIAILLHINKQ